MDTDRQPPGDGLGYIRGVVDAMQREMANISRGMENTTRDIKSEMLAQEQRLRTVISESERRTADRFADVTRNMEAQNTHLRATLNENSQQWLKALESTQERFTETTKDLQDKLQTLMPWRDRLIMIIGGLTLLGFLAKPFIEKLFQSGGKP